MARHKSSRNTGRKRTSSASGAKRTGKKTGGKPAAGSPRPGGRRSGTQKSPSKGSAKKRPTARRGGGKKSTPKRGAKKRGASSRSGGGGSGGKTVRRASGATYADAEAMAKSQRAISISEFFAKNRHLLGFDNPRKALLTTVKEAVDNALDACEEAGIVPVVELGIEQLSETHFRIAVQDNGPGILRKQIPSIFGRLLYGSKFHRLRMSRGQQGIGISAAGMYGLLTTGQPVKITSRTDPRAKAHYYELQIDTRTNRPDIITDEPVDWDVKHGTRVQIELEARYQKGRQSVDDYLAQTAIANPHVTLIYHAPDGREETYDAGVNALPPVPKSIRPHPYGIELGVLLKMMSDSKARTVTQFLTTEFCRVSPRVAQEILAKAGVRPKAKPSRLNGDAARGIYRAIQDTRIMAPATDCVVPIGEDKLVAGLKEVVDAAFYTATTRRPAVYRGNPFIIEAALAYGRCEKDDQAADGEARRPPGDGARKPGGNGNGDRDGDPLAKLIRFANRVPLQYQQSACAIYKAVAGMNWKSYGLSQARGALPAGPLTVVLHMASVWVPFTSESKEAIASYPEILKEMRLALQECGRKLGRHVNRARRMRQELKKRSYIEKYIPAIGEALRDILDLKDAQVNRVCGDLKDILQRSRKL
ncbi:MAG: DNA topoisomerase VI subunit B [Planctomycetota bacterium]